MSDIQTPADLVCSDSRKFIEVYLSLSDGPQRVERILIDADQAEYSTHVDLMQLLRLIHAAMLLADLSEVGSFAPWYRNKARSLLLKATDLAKSLQKPAVFN